jgi:hypothetical protein
VHDVKHALGARGNASPPAGTPPRGSSPSPTTFTRGLTETNVRGLITVLRERVGESPADRAGTVLDELLANQN